MQELRSRALGRSGDETPQSCTPRVLNGPERFVLGIAVICLGAWALNTACAGVYQFMATRTLDRSIQASDSDQRFVARRTRASATTSGVVGRIVIPGARISAIVAEGTRASTLRRAVGHVEGTPYPGEAGNAALAGHRDSFFRGLGKVRLGDRIEFTTPDGTFDYAVSRTGVVGPRDVQVLDARPGSTLTLVTCYPFNALGPAPDRFIVQAEAVAASASMR